MIGTIVTGGPGLEIVGCGKLGGILNPPCFFYRTSDQFELSLDEGANQGEPLVGDELRIIADGLEASVESLETLEMSGTDLPLFAILDEQVVEAPDVCLADIDGSGEVEFGDLLAVLTAWGPCPGCPEDLNGTDEVDFGDLLEVLTAWGPC